ncbi:hypothetical protein FB45DRAFT_1086957 [Roridomyces roridus]|uniref:DUF7330 domain-containing protein n=1 Tax=Roridomyces roridus TaxID=1738132 RepID=A0AAD7BLZ5_9AGAR|nr:hypothetical protein FB45DRAFT_1086957 [Roridomyces roridus]
MALKISFEEVLLSSHEDDDQQELVRHVPSPQFVQCIANHPLRWGSVVHQALPSSQFLTSAHRPLRSAMGRRLLPEHREGVLDTMTAVQISPTGLPPYTETTKSGSSSAKALEDWHGNSPLNNILISRTFGSIKNRFTVDPNNHPPSCLLRAVSAREDSEELSKKLNPRTAGGTVELYVTYGRIDAEVCMLPLSESALCARNGFPCCPKSEDDKPPPCAMEGRVFAITTIGDVTVKGDAGELNACTARLIIQAYSTWGQVAVFIPRSFQGPLVASCFGTPRLSSTLAPLCTPIKEVGGAKRWFVGSLDEWLVDRGHGDDLTVRTDFGKVWVGYEGEEEEARKALRWGPVQWLAHIVPAVLILWFMRIVLAILLWFLHLVRII